MKLVALSLLALSLASCSNSTSSPSTTAASQYIAQDSSFANFQSWARDGAPRIGPDPTGLLGTNSSTGGPHGCCDTLVTRITYMNSSNPQRDASGHFPIGTIFVKTSSMNGQVQMVTGMAKRSGGYNNTGNGWEYFMLSPMNGTIMARGDTLMGGMCKGCHAAGKDDIFTR